MYRQGSLISPLIDKIPDLTEGKTHIPRCMSWTFCPHGHSLLGAQIKENSDDKEDFTHGHWLTSVLVIVCELYEFVQGKRPKGVMLI